MLTNSRGFGTKSEVAKRPWKESKLVITLPDDVIAAISDEATLLYKSTPQFLRDLLIERVRAPQLAPAAPTMTYGPRTSRSGFKGVYAYGKRWEAVAHVNGRRSRLGTYDTAEAAAHAYDDYLVAQAGDPSAAVNFPSATEVTAQGGAPFVEQFASGRRLTDIEWKQWQQQQPVGAAIDAPLTVRDGSGPPIDATTPLIDRPSKTLYRRDSTPTISRPDPEPDDDDGTLS